MKTPGFHGAVDRVWSGVVIGMEQGGYEYRVKQDGALTR